MNNYNKNECWYKEVCSKYKTNKCKEDCIRYVEMFNLLEKSRLPKNKYNNMDLTPETIDYDKFVFLKNYKDNIKFHTEKGNNLYIFSHNFGNGKTTWAIKLLLKFFDDIWSGNGLKERAYFIHVPTFLIQYKNNISEKNEEFEVLKQKLLEVDLVVWDDIASTKLSDYDHALLLTYIDQRNLYGLSNIYTGNLDRLQLDDALGQRLASRVYDCSEVIELKGMNRRKTNG